MKFRSVNRCSVLASSLLLLFSAFSEFRLCFANPKRMEREGVILGGIHDSVGFENSVEIEDLARFAVDEHNKKQNALLEFGRVVMAKEQVVAGMMHHLTLEVIEAGKKKLCEAKVWVKPWMNFKELHEFRLVGDAPTVASSDLGAKRGN
ncbi:PREDICTED: cysteine proteinase inhibitor A-like [Nelumbo nucifera]|uniref:Cysteine proteinase inhibitor n=1 Tax=Nelumbo nucifera TaxID=4432 RepID=A0A1U7Z1F5_NELNU|nr:PREDICTED: cysteine proteinase inhibitor A-like [Nelumbo nucifera]